MDRKVRVRIWLFILFVILCSSEILLLRFTPHKKNYPFPIEQIPIKNGHPPGSQSASLLAFGDINLGRWVGQKIVHGDINYPFELIDIHGYSADIVFGNLESIISDQKGKTGDSRNNLIFNGPPEGVLSLNNAGITIVSVANNHVFDFHQRGAMESVDRLSRGNILIVGASRIKEKLYDPVIIEKNSIKFAIFAVTSFMNYAPRDWRSVVAFSDTGKLFPKIRLIRNSVDVVVVSYHGGMEYSETPAKYVTDFSSLCIHNGVDIFIGHHPHVTFGIQKIGHSYILHSLGNFVFYQPQHYWTQRSYGVEWRFEKQDSITTANIQKIIPLNVGFQTSVLTDSIEKQKLFDRTQKLSNFDLTPFWE